jgi:ubiquitin carboxyl-terminal hydrolase 5/13
LKHFEETGKKYPLCVKLGTITANGADVWSYADDEDALVIDPKLSDHLSHWGIDIMKLEKTDKTLGKQ